jgi:hypothetical protein
MAALRCTWTANVSRRVVSPGLGAKTSHSWLPQAAIASMSSGSFTASAMPLV